MDRAERRKYADEVTRINRRFEAAYFPRVEAALNSKKSSLISEIKKGGLQSGIKLLHHDLTNPELTAVVKNLYKTVGGRHARRAHSFILAETSRKGVHMLAEQKGFGFNLQWITDILNYLNEFLISKITFTVNETTRDALMEVMQQAVANGWGVDKTVQELEDLPFTRYQAARIVRTEINRAANVGTAAAVDTSKWQMQKVWISAHDNRTRGNPMNGDKDHADHWDLDGVRIDYEDRFKDPRSGDSLMFPGDANASAATTVNCRCTFAPISKRDERGRLIPKQRGIVTPMLGLTRPPIAASPGQQFRR